MMTYDELEAFFLNHDEPYLEYMQDEDKCATDEYACGFGSTCLRGHQYSQEDLLKFVKKIRSYEE